jgi:hypothetical protein
MQEKVSCMRHSVKIEKSVTSGELFWRELSRASFPQKQFPLGDRFFHLHLTLMQDTYNLNSKLALPVTSCCKNSSPYSSWQCPPCFFNHLLTSALVQKYRGFVLLLVTFFPELFTLLCSFNLG